MARDGKLGGDAKRLVLATNQQQEFRRARLRQMRITATGQLTAATGKENLKARKRSTSWGIRNKPVLVAILATQTRQDSLTRSPAGKARALTGLHAPGDTTPVLAGTLKSPRRILVHGKPMNRTGKVETAPGSNYFTFADETAPYIPPKPAGQALIWSDAFFKMQQHLKALTNEEQLTTSIIITEKSFPPKKSKADKATKKPRLKTQDQIMQGTAQHYMESRGFIYQDANGSLIKTEWFWGHLLADTLLPENDPTKVNPGNLMAVTRSANAYEAAITGGLKDAIQAANSPKGYWTLTITATRTKAINEVTGETLYIRSASDKQTYSYVYTDEHGLPCTPINFHIEPLNPNTLSYAGIRKASQRHFSLAMKRQCLFSPDSQRRLPPSFFHQAQKKAAQAREADKPMPLVAQCV